MVTVVQLVRASDCGSECRGFESHRSPFFKSLTTLCCEGFFLSIYLLPPLSAFRPPAQPQCDKAPVAVHSRYAPFLVSRLCCRRCACRTVALDRKSVARLLSARTRAPMPVAADNALPRFIVVCEAGQIVSLGGEVMPRHRCVSRKDGRDLSKRTFSRARERVRTPQFFVFCLHPSPACVRRSKSN